MERREVPAANIIDNSSGDYFIRIPEGDGDREIMHLVESFPLRFADTGLRISTGPVVLFRATQYLLSDAAHEDAVPLLHPHNVKPFATLWPLAKNGKPMALEAMQRVAEALASHEELRPGQAIQFQGRKAAIDRRLFSPGRDSIGLYRHREPRQLRLPRRA